MKHTIQINHAAKVQFFEPVLVSDLREAIDELPVRLLGTRDKAVLLVSFLGKFQRTKLSRLDLCDVSNAAAFGHELAPRSFVIGSQK